MYLSPLTLLRALGSGLLVGLGVFLLLNSPDATAYIRAAGGGGDMIGLYWTFTLGVMLLGVTLAAWPLLEDGI